MDLVDAIRATIAAAPRARAALDAILDRRERDGRLPRTITVDADASVIAALRALFSTRAVAPVPPARARIDLSRAVPAGVELDRALYAALARVPRDPRAELAAHQDALRRELAALPTPRHTVSRAFLADERAAAEAGTGETWELAASGEVARAAAIVADVIRALDALLELTATIRIANFAARVLGDSKALLPGSDRARRLAETLIAYDPATQADVAAMRPATQAATLAAALEVRGLLRDSAGILAHVFGPLVYARGDVRFDHVARHALLGDPTPLSLAQLRDATLVELPAERITVIENQAPFLDYIERADPRRELVVFARGQASWAVVVLLRMCAAARLPIRHAGDLDRAGVLILRSLERRVHARIEPWHMDIATHRRFATGGRAIDSEE
ncbi:MAG TPA: DUF2399 domain-containing protein, partial [Kofleriaceae bacterium]|nr:DUF2399 domain-containing protein [Kofleriaceae bacterium]